MTKKNLECLENADKAIGYRNIIIHIVENITDSALLKRIYQYIVSLYINRSR